MNLALKALPASVDEKNYHRVELFNFQSRQQSIISFKNNELDMLFKFYDNRNKARLRKLSTRAREAETQSQKIQEDMNAVVTNANKLKKTAENNAGMNRKRKH